MKTLALLSMLLAAAPARADIVRMRPFEAGNRSIGLQLGAARPTEPLFKQTVRSGAISNAQALVYAWDWIAVGAELGYLRFFKKNLTAQSSLTGVPASTDLNSEAQALAALAVVRVNFFERGTWTPYALGGAGMHRFEQTITAAVTVAGQPANASFTSNATGLAVTAGAGVEVFLVRDASFSFEARFHQFRLDSAKFANNAESLSYMLGFHFWWGRDW